MKYFFEVKRDALGHWRWYLKCNNGHTIGMSSEGYHRARDCIAPIRNFADYIKTHDVELWRDNKLTITV